MLMQAGLSRLFYLLLFVVSALFLLPQCTSSEGGSTNDGYPERPITYIVPWSAGGMTDVSSRVTATVLQKPLGQSVNVVNRTGGGGVVGHLALSSSRPDGYTIGAVTVEISMLHHMGLTDLSYTNYTPLALLINNAAAITVRADAPWNTLDELIAAIRANPGQLKASGTARGGIWDLARLGFLKVCGLPSDALPWVPSQGSAPALQELLAEGVDVVTASLTEVHSLREAGQVKTLAVMAENRLERFPDVPTLKELGYDWSIGGWVSACAPADLPEEIRTKLISALQTATKDPEFTTALNNAGSNIQLMFGEELEQFMAEQDRVNGELMREAGIAE
ncbi:MAG: tripartite tricarboxylate transporter substrate binding protein [Lewinella sp.]|nr:tripartite tricarboxylate transporter substrate binding protein [Lewinella sp.]